MHSATLTNFESWPASSSAGPSRINSTISSHRESSTNEVRRRKEKFKTRHPELQEEPICRRGDRFSGALNEEQRRAMLLRSLQERGQGHLQKLIENSGPYLSLTVAAQRLSMTTRQIKAAIRERRLLAIEAPSTSEVQIPEWQIEGAQVLAGLPEALQAIPAYEPMKGLLFLQAPAPQYDDLTPVELLRQNRLEDVVSLAQSMGEQGGR